MRFREGIKLASEDEVDLRNKRVRRSRDRGVNPSIPLLPNHVTGGLKQELHDQVDVFVSSRVSQPSYTILKKRRR